MQKNIRPLYTSQKMQSKFIVNYRTREPDIILRSIHTHLLHFVTIAGRCCMESYIKEWNVQVSHFYCFNPWNKYHVRKLFRYKKEAISHKHSTWFKQVNCIIISVVLNSVFRFKILINMIPLKNISVRYCNINISVAKMLSSIDLINIFLKVSVVLISLLYFVYLPVLLYYVRLFAAWNKIIPSDCC